MYSNSFYPLRRIVSKTVPIKDIRQKPSTGAKLIYQSETAEALNYKSLTRYIRSLNELSAQQYYRDFLPEFGGQIVPGNGMDQLPATNSFSPFASGDPLLSICGKTDTTDDLTLSRKLSAKYLITIDNDAFFNEYGRKPLIGGICFKGFPYAAFGLNDNGENASNFGLPREVRITCINIPGRDYEARFTDFLDEEITSVDQQITSHSGFHYVCCDPTFATHIILELSDFPYFTKNVSPNADIERSDENFYGLLIPYLYVFEYEKRPGMKRMYLRDFLEHEKPALLLSIEMLNGAC